MELRIKEILIKAEEIVNDSGINENLRQVAFGEVFRVLFAVDHKPFDKSPKKLEKEKVSTIKNSTKSSTSPAKLVEGLIEGNFFTEKRRDVDCIEQINLSKGVRIPRGRMATVLVRKLRSGILKREHTKEGYVYFIN